MIGCGHADDRLAHHGLGIRLDDDGLANGGVLRRGVGGERLVRGRGECGGTPHGVARRILGVLLGVLGGVLRDGFLDLFLTAFGHRCLVHDRNGRGGRAGLAGSRDALGHLGGVDRRGLERVCLPTLLDALGANLAQAEELPAGQEEREGDEGEHAGRQEGDDRQHVGLFDLPCQRQRQIVGAARGGGDGGAAARHVLQVDGHGARAALLLEPHRGLRQLIRQLRGRRVGDRLGAGLDARLSVAVRAGLGARLRAGVRVHEARSVRRVGFGLELVAICLDADDLGVGGVADPPLRVLRGADHERHGRARLRGRGDLDVILDDRQHVVTRHDQVGRRIHRRHLLRRRPQDGHAEQPDKDAYECDSAHRRCRHVSLQEFHGCSSGPTPTVRAFFRPHFTCKHCEQAHAHARQ